MMFDSAALVVQVKSDNMYFWTLCQKTVFLLSNFACLHIISSQNLIPSNPSRCLRVMALE